MWILATQCTFAAVCGNSKREAGEACDNGNTTGWVGWVVASGYACSGGDPTRKDTWYEVWGDGKNLGQWAWDDGNTNNADGWDSWCSIEENAAWSGGSSTTAGNFLIKIL